MICQHCGNMVPDASLICPQCGAQVRSVRRQEGLAARRQGRPDQAQGEKGSSPGRIAPLPWAEEAPPVERRREAYRAAGSAAGKKPAREDGRAAPRAAVRKARGRRKDGKRPMVNWAMIWAVVIVLVVLALAGSFVFLKLTDQGQLILARMGQDVNATALWAYGQELFDQGYVDRSIAIFEQAYAMEPEREDLYSRLLQLADAYEAASRTADAEAVYTKLYTDIAPQDSAIYRQVVRLMESQGRQMELAEFLKMAYEKTGDISFRRQRDELLPSSPKASKGAGSIKYEQDIQLFSDEDYEIYYLFGDEGELPEEGTLYTGPIHLGEGTHIIRAVAVSSDLISDETRVQYIISLPKPAAPYASLAPGPYERRQRIWLKYNGTEDEKLLEQQRDLSDSEKEILAKLKDITIYYTVDGQTPTSNSPIYTGEPFLLPLGPSLVKAVAVNGYGKVSNVMERTYNIKLRFEYYFKENDEFSDFTLLTTSRDAFVKKMGQPAEEAAVSDDSVPGDSIRLLYSWGEARFYMTDKGYMLYAVETSSPSMTGPRKTKIGMTETEITQKYRDMGQDYNQDGSRSIYYNSDEKKYGMLYHLDAFNDRIDYSYARTDNGVVTLSYFLENSKVVKMSIRCAFY